MHTVRPHFDVTHKRVCIHRYYVCACSATRRARVWKLEAVWRSELEFAAEVVLFAAEGKYVGGGLLCVVVTILRNIINIILQKFISKC